MGMKDDRQGADSESANYQMSLFKRRAKARALIIEAVEQLPLDTKVDELRLIADMFEKVLTEAKHRAEELPR